jgi:hypothetical protein
MKFPVFSLYNRQAIARDAVAGGAAAGPHQLIVSTTLLHGSKMPRPWIGTLGAFDLGTFRSNRPSLRREKAKDHRQRPFPTDPGVNNTSDRAAFVALVP